MTPGCNPNQGPASFTPSQGLGGTHHQLRRVCSAPQVRTVYSDITRLVDPETTFLQPEGRGETRLMQDVPGRQVECKSSAFFLNETPLKTQSMSSTAGKGSLIDHGDKRFPGEEEESQDSPSDLTSLHDTVSSFDRSTHSQPPVSSDSVTAQEKEDSPVFASNPKYHVPSGALSFRQFYFRSTVVKGPRPGQWYEASNDHSNLRFLRKARYLEKLAKDYDLDSVTCPSTVDPFVATCAWANDQPEIRSERSSHTDMLSTFSDAEEDTASIGGRHRATNRQEEQMTPSVGTADDISHTAYQYSNHKTDSALLNKGKIRTDTAALRRFPKLGFSWYAIKHSFIGSMFRLPKSISGPLSRMRKYSRQGVDGTCPGSLTEACISLSEASLVPPSVSSQHHQAYCQHGTTEDQRTGDHSGFRDKNRSATPQTESELGLEQAMPGPSAGDARNATPGGSSTAVTLDPPVQAASGLDEGPPHATRSSTPVDPALHERRKTRASLYRATITATRVSQCCRYCGSCFYQFLTRAEEERGSRVSTFIRLSEVG